MKKKWHSLSQENGRVFFYIKWKTILLADAIRYQKSIYPNQDKQRRMWLLLLIDFSDCFFVNKCIYLKSDIERLLLKREYSDWMKSYESNPAAIKFVNRNCVNLIFNEAVNTDIHWSVSQGNSSVDYNSWLNILLNLFL